MKHISRALLILAVLTLTASQSTPFEVEKLLPAETLFLVQIPNGVQFRTAFEKTNLYRLVRDPEVVHFLEPLLAPVEKEFQKFKEDLKKDLGITLESALEVLSGQAAFGLVGLPEPSKPKEPDFFLTLDASQQADTLFKLVEFIKKEYKQKPEAYHVGGIEVLLFGKGGVHLARSGDVLIVTTRKARMEALLSPAPEKTLAASPLYQQAAARAEGKNASLFFYVNLKTLLDGVKPHVEEKDWKTIEALGSGSFTSIAGSVRLEEGVVREKLTLGTTKERKGLARLLDALKPGAPDFSTAPENALMFSSGSIDWKKYYETGIDILKQSGRVELEQLVIQIEQFEKDCGFSIPEDLLGCLGNTALSYLMCPQDSPMPDTIMIFELKDKAKFEKCLEILKNNLGIEIDRIPYNGKEIRLFRTGPEALQNPILMNLGMYSWTTDGDRLVVGAYSPNALKRWIQSEKKTASQKRLPIDASGATAISFVDLEKGFNILYNTVTPFVSFFRGPLVQAGVPLDPMHLPLGETIGRYLSQSINVLRVDADGLVLEGVSGTGVTVTTLFGGGVAAALFVPAIARAEQNAKVTACVNNLGQLWKSHHNYVVQFGGAKRTMCTKTGKAFWLELTQTNPPIINPFFLDLLACPASGKPAAPNVCLYRGPKRDVNTLREGDVVGCDDPTNHPDGTICVLRRGGDVQIVRPGDPLYQKALEDTTDE